MGLFSWLFGRCTNSRSIATNDKALLVGINAYDGAPLRGCVNDVMNMKEFLVSQGYFKPENICVLLNRDAKTSAILDKLSWLVDVTAGSKCFYHYSGHGAQVPNPEEEDGLSEVQCPQDFDWSPGRMITDKQFVNIFSKIPPGVKFNWLSDSCVAGDTKIPLLDGTEKTISEMEKEKGKYWVYSSLPNGEIVPGLAHSARITGNKKVLKIRLDNNETIECTPDHLMMLRDGTFKQAEDIKIGESLMPLYRKIGEKNYIKGYEMVLTTSAFGNRVWRPTHLVVRDFMKLHKKGSKKSICHHKNFNKRDNRPDNLEMTTWQKHKKMHGSVGRNNFKKVWKENTAYIAWRSSDEYKKQQSERVRKIWQNPKHHMTHAEANRQRYQRLGMPEKFTAYNFSDENRRRTKERCLPSGDLYKVLHKPSVQKKIIAFVTSPEHRATMMAGYRKYVQQRRRQKLIAELNNHKVISIEITNRVIPVYDLTVEKHHNFAVSAGVFVHNCHSGDLDREIPLAVLKKGVPNCARRMLPPPHIASIIQKIKSKAHKVTRMREMVGGTINVGFISACRSDQTAADTEIDGQACGAFTAYFLKAANYFQKDITLANLVDQIRLALSTNGYDQIPQVDGPRATIPLLS